MAEDNKSDRGGTILLIAAASFFIISLLLKIWGWFVVWIKNPMNMGLFIISFLILSIPLFMMGFNKLKKIRKENLIKRNVLSKPKDDSVGAVYCGEDKNNKLVWIKNEQRGMHTQVIGTTNAGKTESVILPWAIQDIQQGRGLILIDGKADSSLLSKLWAYTVEAGRENDFRLFSLSNVDESHQFNPLIGGSAEEISERVFNAFEFENPYYKSLQYEVFSQIMRIFEAAKITPTFAKIYQAIGNPDIVEAMARKLQDQSLKDWSNAYKSFSPSERAQRTSGLTAAISHFSQGTASCLFNAETSPINLDVALAENQIIYFQLPVLKTPFLGKSAGRMILQSLQSAISNRHNSQNKEVKFFSVFLDDFTEYLYSGFVSILNKSRSAKIGVVFAHQALGDIKSMGDAVANAILTNSNLKIFMRGNDPDSADYFARMIGTEKDMKYTERTKMDALGNKGTGEASAREVDKFTFSPNKFKRELGIGEAIMVVPYSKGSKNIEIKFDMFPDIEAKKNMQSVKKEKPVLIELSADNTEFKST